MNGGPILQWLEFVCRHGVRRIKVFDIKWRWGKKLFSMDEQFLWKMENLNEGWKLFKHWPFSILAALWWRQKMVLVRGEEYNLNCTPLAALSQCHMHDWSIGDTYMNSCIYLGNFMSQCHKLLEYILDFCKSPPKVSFVLC